MKTLSKWVPNEYLQPKLPALVKLTLEKEVGEKYFPLVEGILSVC
jgi:hypothetical protein